MPEFKERKPPVLDDIIEPGVAEKAKPAVDDTQPSLWGEEELSVENTRAEIDTGDIEITAVNLYDTLEIDLATQVRTLEDDFDIDEAGNESPPGNITDPDPAAAARPGYAPVETGTHDASDGQHSETGHPATGEAPAERFDDPSQPVNNRLEETGTQRRPVLPSAEPGSQPVTATSDIEMSPGVGMATAEEPLAHEPVDFSEMHDTAATAAHATELEVLTNKLVRSLMPEIELILRKRIHEELDKALTGKPFVQDTD